MITKNHKKDRLNHMTYRYTLAKLKYFIHHDIPVGVNWQNWLISTSADLPHHNMNFTYTIWILGIYSNGNILIKYILFVFIRKYNIE